MTVVQRDPERLDRLFKLIFKIGCIGRILRPERIRNIHIRTADILFIIVPDCRDVLRHLAEPVVFIPGEQQAGFLPRTLQRFGYKKARCHITEVSDMDRPGRADPRGTDIFFLVRALFNNLLCYLI